MKKMITKLIGVGLNTLAYVAPKKAARIGFELFCHPHRTPINEKQKAFFRTADQQSFSYNGINIQTYRWGNGPKRILLLHGWQSHTYRWKAYIEKLGQEHTVFALDAPGHGLSGGKFLSVPLYGEVIDEYIKRIGDIDTIVAHSLGGFATFYAFYQNPSLQSQKIITLASPGEAQEFFDFYARTLRLTSKTSKLIVNRFEQTFNRKPEFFSAPVFASSLRIPGIIIHDEYDNEAPFYHAERIHGVWKNSRLIKTNGLGHNLKSPELVKDVIQLIGDPLVKHFSTPTLAENTLN